MRLALTLLGLLACKQDEKVTDTTTAGGDTDTTPTTGSTSETPTDTRDTAATYGEAHSAADVCDMVAHVYDVCPEQATTTTYYLSHCEELLAPCTASDLDELYAYFACFAKGCSPDGCDSHIYAVSQECLGGMYSGGSGGYPY